MRLHALLAIGCLVLQASAQWTALDPGTNQDLRSVQYSASGQIWIGSFDTLLWSPNNGANFVKRPTLMQGSAPIFGLYLATEALADQSLLITGTIELGAWENIFRSTDGGLAWSRVHHAQAGPINVLRDLLFAQPPLGFAVGDNGRILRSTDSGQSWAAVPSGTVFSLERIVHATGNTYMAAGSSAFVRSTDGGLSWSPVNGPSEAYDLACMGNTCYATQGSSLWKSTDGGATWAASGTSPGRVMALLDANTLLMANDTGLFRTTSGGSYWEWFPLPNYHRIRAFDFRTASSGIAVGDTGYAIQTANAGGAAWPVASIGTVNATLCQGSTITFPNTGDPSWAYTWRINGAVTSTSYDLTMAFPDAGTYTVEMEANNGTGVCTASTTVQILPQPTVTPFTAYPLQDTICQNSSTSIHLPQAEQGTVYRLLHDGTQVAISYGNGGAQNLSTGNIIGPTTFTVQAIRTNTCGSDTLSMPVTVTTPYLAPDVYWEWAEPEACAPAMPVVEVHNSKVGMAYWATNSSPPYPVNGTGGTIQIPFAWASSPTVSSTVRTKMIGSIGQGCPSLWLPDQPAMTIYSVWVHFFADSLTIVDQELNITPSSNQNNLYNYHWDFGQDAVPPSSDTYLSQPFHYTSPGVKTITCIATTPLATCADTIQQSTLVVEAAASTIGTACNEGFTALDGYIADMALDAYNNRYLTGYIRTTGSSSQEVFFAMKLDSTGQEVWHRTAPISTDWQNTGSQGYGIAADRAGNAYVTGRFNHDNGSLDGTVIYHRNFLVKFDPQGHLEWQMISPSNAFRGVACTDDDILHVAGRNAWGGTTFFLPSGEEVTTVLPVNQRGSLFLLSVSPNGSILQQQALGYRHPSGAPDQRSAIDMDSDALDAQERLRCDPIMRKAADGSILISGIMKTLPAGYGMNLGEMEVQGNTEPSSMTNLRQIYAMRYVPGTGVTGAFAWGGGDPRSVEGISQSLDGRLAVCGRYKNTFKFNGETEVAITSGGSSGSYLFCTAADGSALWNGATTFGSTMLDDLAFETDGTLIALASYVKTGFLPTTAGNAPLGVVAGTYTHYGLARYDDAGVLTGVETFGDGIGKAFNIRRASCGDLHLVNFETAYTSNPEGIHFTCSGCPDNLRTSVIPAGECTSGCFAANNPLLRDVGMERVALDDSTSLQPNILVSFRNRGQVPAYQATIAYRVNEGPVQTVDWSGNLAYAAAVQDLPIAAYDYTGTHSLRVQAWIDQVNGSMDDYQANDTLKFSQLMCTAPLHGTYTCEAEGADFRTLGDAAKALALCGVDGPTTIAVSPGHHYGQALFKPIPGVSATDTVVITSAAGDSASTWLHFMPGERGFRNAIILFDDTCKHISVTDLTLDHAGSGLASYGVFMARYCTDLGVYRNHVLGKAQGNLIGITAHGGRAPSGEIKVIGNTVERGSRGINIVGALAIDGGPYDKVSIINNRMIDQSSHGLYCYQVTDLTVQDNQILAQEGTHGNLYRAAYMGLGTDKLHFDGNFIRAATTAAPSQGSGVYALVEIFGSVGTGGERRSVTNNMIFNPSATTFSVMPTVRLSCGALDIQHNTFGGLTWIDLSGTDLRNNIFYNAQAAYALDIRVGVETDPGFISDHNVFSSGPAGDYIAPIRYQWNSNSLAQWRSLTGQDQTSIQTLPVFLSSDDLHLNPGSNSFWSPSLPLVTTDIDGEARGPDLTRPGADEDMLYTRIEDRPSSGTIRLAPNPSLGRTTLYLPEALATGHQLLILDAQGRLAGRIPVTAGSTAVPIDLSVAPGIYQVLLTSGQAVVARATWSTLR